MADETNAVEKTTDETTEKYVTADHEVWIQDRIRTAINMAIAVDDQKGVGADKRQAEDAIDGIINGTAVEIVNTLNLETEGENLRLSGRRDDHLKRDE